MDIQPASGLDPAARAGYSDHPPRMGFFTDTSVCIGCKACEVACKEWNAVPEDGLLLTGMSYDNTGGLSASTWRHVAFIEKPPADGGRDVRWLMSSDVCKHCTEAACLDVCPTGALMRTEFGTVVVQDDVLQRVRLLRVGVPVRRDRKARVGRGRAQVHAVLRPDRRRADAGLREGLPHRVHPVRAAGRTAGAGATAGDRTSRCGPAGSAALRADPGDGVGGAGAFFLLLDQPEVYGLPPDPVVTTRDLPRMWRNAALAAAGIAAAAVAVGVAGRA